ncbi:unnamed protein product [Schistosoma margrebowiei]|uniref:Uncharacterized protein n=1 Tax=Schistosoma margrebowiei TaxID=48269 RepID=A0A183LAE4_9TREM|nr:unnamed protein product [Schistosoma margrebowiei]
MLDLTMFKSSLKYNYFLISSKIVNEMNKFYESSS